MSIESEDDVKAVAVRRLRESLNLFQKDFWENVGVTMLRGHRYETGQTREIPRDVRRLVFLHYIIGIPTNAPPSVLRELMGEKMRNSHRQEVSGHLAAAEQSIAAAKESLNVSEQKLHPSQRG